MSKVLLGASYADSDYDSNQPVGARMIVQGFAPLPLVVHFKGIRLRQVSGMHRDKKDNGSKDRDQETDL